MTPMVDVMLVLLIIFMIVTPLLQQGVSVNLPRDMISPDEDRGYRKGHFGRRSRSRTTATSTSVRSSIRSMLSAM